MPSPKNANIVNNKRKAYNLGLFGEICVMLYFFILGYKLLGRRVKTPFGELDLIAQKNGLVIFVEVKTRSSIKEQNYEIVSPFQMSRIKKAAAWFLRKKPDQAWRVDVFILSKNIFQTKRFKNVTA